MTIERSLPKNKIQIKANLDELLPSYLLEGAIDPAILVSVEQNNMLVNKMLSSLSPNEKKVICLRFGLGGEDKHTLVEAGKVMEVTLDRIRGLEARALRKLRHPAISSYFEEQSE